jgi:hypothetical protein
MYGTSYCDYLTFITKIMRSGWVDTVVIFIKINYSYIYKYIKYLEFAIRTSKINTIHN